MTPAGASGNECLLCSHYTRNPAGSREGNLSFQISVNKPLRAKQASIAVLFFHALGQAGDDGAFGEHHLGNTFEANDRFTGGNAHRPPFGD